ncbi:multicopper oxidase family protein [Roseibium marinum]|uniref:FtsP/CotA-like multicopper oxidase with cupredoxin domain n=1 Tax=Roseibium marinum TaxID=281252 RepID=A0A2S3ULY1_9HYPH|nr:multicopper oxidase family protein [Roseibium marinum]POF28691.1 FtsP/CotA-like multicopper oxidase with cupredoxin domain [Roseibium marinum]
MNRRSFLKASVAGCAATLMPTFSLAKSDDGFFELTAGKGQARLFGDDGGLSDLWLYNGRLPGPEIRVKRGERVRVRFLNKLDEPTSVHWHGIRIDNTMDGVAGLTQPAVKAGESFDYDFVAPDAGTYWYHAHTMSWNQVPRGLAGPLIVEDDVPAFDPALDITLMLSDWRLDDNGVMETASFGGMHDFAHAGRLGNWMTINGVSMPDIPLQKDRWHRLRLVNSSSARVLDLAPSRFGARVIALDGQPFETPRDMDGTLQLSPGQRMDVVMRPEETGAIPFETMTGQPITFATFKVGEASAPDRPLMLPARNDLPEPDLENARELPLDMAGGAMGGMRGMMGSRADMQRRMQEGLFWAFNGKGGMDDTPMFSSERGETIVVESRNDTAFAHAIHLHGHHFRVLERNGRKLVHPDWRDTYTTVPDETVKIAFVADNPGKWLIHCHMLGHAASGMMDWFEVG